MNHSFRTAAVHIALAAMLLRALMPAGWMPNADAAAGTPITICTMNGAVQIDLVADPLKKNHHQDNSRHHETCPFAAAPHMAQPAAITAFTLPSPIAMSEQFSAHRGVAGYALLYAPQIPRAPPRLA